MKGEIAVIKDTRAPMPTVLGQRSTRIPTAGKIRAGIKVLTRRAQENAHACDIYQHGIEEERSFDEIERALAKAIPDLQHPLVPKNVPYFTVRGSDFPNPDMARQIMDLYAEDRGDGVLRLYRLPVLAILRSQSCYYLSKREARIDLALPAPLVSVQIVAGLMLMLTTGAFISQ